MKQIRFGRCQCAIALLQLLCIVIASGCQLPNVGPFVEGTGQLKVAVASSGIAVQEALLATHEGQAHAERFEIEWKARNDAMAAMLRYAESLDAIVAAGKSGSETAGKVADSVKELAGAAGIAMPGTAAIGLITDTGKLVYAQLANVRAAGSLAEAMDAAQPAIEAIADHVRKDLADLNAIVELAYSNADTAILSEPDVNQLTAYRKLIVSEMRKHEDPSKKEDRELQAELSKLLTETDLRLAPSRAKQDENKRHLRTARQLIAETGIALDAWSTAHAQLAVAARNKAPASTAALVEAAAQLRDLVKRMRDL